MGIIYYITKVLNSTTGILCYSRMGIEDWALKESLEKFITPHPEYWTKPVYEDAYLDII